MALPTIPDVYRVAMNFNTADGISPVNVFHIGSPTGDVTEVGEAIDTCLQANMWCPVPERYEPNTFTVTPLDGGSAGVVFTRTGTEVLCGYGSTTDAIIDNAYVLSFRSSIGGPRGRNRIFIGPVAETATENGMTDSDVNAQILGAWNAFQDALLANDPQCFQLEVSYVHADAHPIIARSISPNLGTQRRRLVAQRH